MLDKARILAANDLPRRVIDVPEWGGEVTVQALDALSAIRISKLVTEDEPMTRLRILAACLVDEAGEKLFGLDEIEALGKKNWEVVKRLSDIAFEMNGYHANATSDAQKN